MSKGELFTAAGFGSAALDYDIVYHRPMRVGQAVEVRSGLLNAGDKVFHFFHHLVDSSTGEAITSIVVAAVFFDLVARKSVPIGQALPGDTGGPLAALAARTGSAASGHPATRA